MTVIMPPSSDNLNTVRELLKLAADPPAMKQALEQLQALVNERALKIDAARAAQRDAADAEARARETMAELERTKANIESRENDLAQREKNVAAREAKLEALRRQVA